MSFGRRIKKAINEAVAAGTPRSHAVYQVVESMKGLINEGKIKPYEISFADLAFNIVGDDWSGRINALNANTWRLRESTGGDSDLTLRVLESGAGEAVDASAFADITGQLLVNEIRQKFNAPGFIGDTLMERVPITNGNLGTQKTPWLGDVLQTGHDKIQPAEPYPHTQFSEQYQIYPAPEKHGQICAVTMEMLYSDLTSQALDSAGSVGRALRYEKELMQMDVVLGNTNNFNFMGSAYNTYVPTSAAFTNGYVNELGDEALTDWTNVNNLEQLFYVMVDPATGRRIFVEPKFMLVPNALKYTAKRVVRATETRTGDITSGSGNQVLAPNPLDREYTVVASPFVYERLVNAGVTGSKANNYWYLIDPKAFVWREVYGLRTENAPKGNPMEFLQDISVQVKAGWFGVAAVRSPWHVARSKDN